MGYYLHSLIDKGSVAKIDKPEEEPVVHGPGEGRHRVQAVVRVLTLVHPLRADLEYHDQDQVENGDVDDYVVDDDVMTHLDLGSDEVAIEELPVLDPVKLANLLSRFRVVHLATFLATLLLERHLWGERGEDENDFSRKDQVTSEVSNGRSELESVRLKNSLINLTPQSYENCCFLFFRKVTFSSGEKPRVSKATSVNSNSSASSMESTFTFPCK